MNIQELANLIKTGRNPRQGLTIDRLERIKRVGSPTYTWIMPVTATTATAVIYVPTQFPASRKYEPLDYLEIVNNSVANNLTLVINGSDTRSVPSGTIRTIHGSGVALWHIAVTNNGAVNTTLGLIVLTLQKEPLTMDKWIQNNG